MAAASFARPMHSALDATLETIDSVITLVDAYERGHEQTPPWGRCQPPLEEVRGALIMVQLDGARLLVDECIALMEALETDTTIASQHAIDALLYALLLLPRHISRARTTGREVPDTLLPTINGLRGLRRAVLIPEYDFTDLGRTSLQLAPLAESLGEAGTPDPDTTRRLRHMLQAGLLGLFQSPEASVHYKQVHRALSRLATACGDTPAGRWLTLAALLAENAERNGVRANGSVRLMISRLDLYIRETLLATPPQTGQAPPPMVRQALLYYTAQNSFDSDRSNHALLRAIAEDLNLDSAITPRTEIQREGDAIAAPDVDVMQAVTRALGEEMDQIQAFIETLSRLSSVTHTEREELAAHLHRLGHTLTLLGLSEAAAAVKREHTRLQSLGDDVDAGRLRDTLSHCAETLSASESAAARLATPGEPVDDERNDRLADASHQALAEALNNLARVRASLEFFNGDVEEGDELASARQPLDEVRGGLTILGLSRAAALVGRCNTAIAALDESDVGNSERLNAVADALAALEWYLETMLEGLGAADDMLDIADASVA
ncbi:hypothetical protein [Aquisalimonas asiatica]|uniref:Scaffold protein FimL second domain-containing protein n=1 Tax=Aquisalimonas asiatica TaxID=406100 RepID=A0A1H8VQ82_9GAMM|nr:hypothetical protein [Aquisalimonas asiatica]SEP17377.1 hypothetical protein SAMN04488052_11430 [Aquisalimonas asiatica]